MSHNDITGDRIASKPATAAFRDNFDAIFKQKPKPAKDEPFPGVNIDTAHKYPSLAAFEPGLAWRVAQQTKGGADGD